MGRVTINGTQSQFSCKRSIPLSLWDAKGRSCSAQVIRDEKRNLYLQMRAGHFTVASPSQISMSI